MNTIMLPRFRGERRALLTVAIAPILLTAALALVLQRPALAQSTPDSATMSDPEDAAPSLPADPPADVPIDGATPAAAADHGSASDDSAADHSGWVRSGDEETGNGSAPDKVLEVPQVVDPANGQAPAGPAQTASGGAASSPDQVGSVDDYQDEDDADIGAVGYISPGSLNPYGAGAHSSAGPLSPPLGSGSVPLNPSGANLGRPAANGMNTAIGSTSPMFPHVLAPMPGGWR